MLASTVLPMLLSLVASSVSVPVDPADATLLDLLRARGGFTTLVELLERAELDGPLAGDGPYTLFAPGDEAFAALPPERLAALREDPRSLAELLRYHGLEGAWTLEAMGRRGRMPSLQGSDLALRQLDDGGYAIDVARFVELDVPARNGVLHVIDSVLLPPGFELVSEADLVGGGVHTYTVDVEHSTILFRVMHTGIGAQWGWFGAFEGELVVDHDDPANSSVIVAVDARSIDTRNRARDDYLQTADFFDTANHPALTFRSTRVGGRSDGRLDVEGELTLRGVTREVSCVASLVGEGRFGPANYRVGYEAELVIRRSEYGMTFGIPGVAGDEVRLTIALEATRPLEPR